MATLKGIVENLAFVFGQQFNATLQTSIADSVIDYRSLLIRRNLDNDSGSFARLLL